MALISKYNLDNLKNEAEKLVFDELERQLDASQAAICRCNECVLDMAALALNSVKPHYQVSLLGSLYTASSMEDKNYAASVRKAVMNAIARISSNPGHDITP